jgi:hypothetical protein
MRKRIVKANEFKDWFDDPEGELLRFQGSGQAIMSVIFDQNNSVVELSQRDVARLLEEFRIMREEA